MVKITAQMVKELREATGAGPLDIKKALEEVGGDKQKAMDFLREKGIAKAAKKLGKERTMNEGSVALWASEDGKHVVLVQVDCETDFVGTNEKFVALSDELAAHVAQVAPADVETMLTQPLHGGNGQTVEDRLKEAIAELGEKMQINGFANITTDGGEIGVYQHFNKRIAAAVELFGDVPEGLSRNIAMHIANLKPEYVNREDVPADVVAHERQVQKNRVIEEGKPEHVADKIVDGRMGKFFEEIVLLEQPFLMDDSKTIAQLLKENGGLTVKTLARYAVGEGVEESDEDE
jgi:elongation factor Ts